MLLRFRQVIEVFRQIVMLLLFGVALVGLRWLFNRYLVDEQNVLIIILNYGWWFALALWFVILFLTGKRIAANYRVQRIDPGNSEQLEQLAKAGKYKLDAKSKQHFAHVANPLKPVLVVLEELGYSLSSRRKGLWVYDQPTKRLLKGKELDRVIVIYKQEISVLDVDQILQTVANMIDNNVFQTDNAKVATTSVLLISENTHVLEAMSAGAGILNYLGRTARGCFVAMLLECRTGYLFYPQELQELPRRHRLACKGLLQDLQKGFAKAEYFTR